MRLDGVHEQAITRPLPHDELVQLQCFPSQAWVSADLAGQGDDLACAALRSPWPPCDVLGCRDPVLSDHQGPFQTAAEANDWNGGQPSEDGEPGLGRAGLYDLVPTAEDTGRPDPVSTRQWALEPAR